MCKTALDFTKSVIEFKSFNSAEQELAGFDANKDSLIFLKLLFELGVSSVVLSTVYDGDYYSATTALAKQKNVSVVISAAESDEDIQSSLNGVKDNSNKQNEQICILGFPDSGSALHAAKLLNDERAVITAPQIMFDGMCNPIFSACVMAAQILIQNDPSYNFNGFSADSFKAEYPLNEAEIQNMIAGGVTAFENVQDGIECVRAVTTRTSVNGISDLSMRSINTVLIIDDVISSIRESLSKRLKGIHLSVQSYDSIASQVMVELNAKKNEGLLESFVSPKVYSHPEDPSICVTELSFNIAHVVSQIHITAHIQL